MPRRLRRTGALVALAMAALVPTALILPARPALALSCPELTPRKFYDRAETVAVAVVIKEANRHVNALQPVVLQVDTVYKGEPGPRIVVMHNAMSGPDIHLEQGRRYLLFLNRHPDGSRRTSLCAGTRLLEGPDPPPEFAAVLGPGRPPAGPSDPAPNRYPGGVPPAAPGSVWTFRAFGFGLPVLLLVLILLLWRRQP